MMGQALRGFVIPKLKSRHGIDVPFRWPRYAGVVGAAFVFTGLVLVLSLLGALGLAAVENLLVVAIGVGSLILGVAGLTWAATRHEARTGHR